MRFLKLNPQRAINVDRIEYFDVTASESTSQDKRDVQLRVITTGGGSHLVSRHAKFADAEQALDDLLRRMAEIVMAVPLCLSCGVSIPVVNARGCAGQPPDTWGLTTRSTSTGRPSPRNAPPRPRCPATWRSTILILTGYTHSTPTRIFAPGTWSISGTT